MLDVIERLRGIARCHRDLRELDRLSERELTDLGVTRDQAKALAALPDDIPGRVEAMGRVFWLDEVALHRDRNAWTEMLETCARCGAVPACQRLMTENHQSASAAREFCPNAAGFAQARG